MLPSNNGRPATGSQSAMQEGHMPRITEDDDDDAPSIPDKSPRRLATRATRSVRRKLSQPSNPPPAYSLKSPSSRGTYVGPVAPLPKDKRPTWHSRRGGWGRIALYVLIVICCIVGLVVGLVVGLKKPGNESGGQGSDEPDAPDEQQPLVFPEGSYTFETALSNVSTACVTDPNVFACYPFQTYSGPNSTPIASFLWTIAASSSDDNYTITMKPNVFSTAQFTDLPLTTSDAGLDSENLDFSYTMGDGAFAVVPQNQSSFAYPDADGGGAVDTTVTCYYNATRMSVRIYTSPNGGSAEFPGNLDTAVDNSHPSSSYDEWPYRVEVTQLVSPGQGGGAPDCRDEAGNPVVDAATGQGFSMPSGQGDNDCGCWYGNFDL